MHIMTDVAPGSRSRRIGGFTLVELLVVIAIIGVLASLLTPVLMKARQQSYKTDCVNNLRNVCNAAQMYASDKRFYPWSRAIVPGGQQPELSEDSDARACLELLYKYGFLDNPKVYICRASTDEEAEAIDDEKERRQSFRLEEHQCSFTWRKKLTTQSDDSRTPLSGDKRGGDNPITNHKDGRHVAFLGGDVQFFDNEQLEDTGNKKTKKPKAELIGWDRIGRN
jgi:prepilin-type N-terminal cleavage/methylation domain-containing protein